MLSFLSTGWVKVVAVVALAAGLVGGGIFVANTWYDRGATAQKQLDAAAQQKIIQTDQTKITEAVHVNDEELLALRTYRDSHPPVAVSLRAPSCVPRSQPAAPAGAASAPAAAPVVQSVSHADPDGNLTDADRGSMLQALAAAADEASARLRAVQAVK